MSQFFASGGQSFGDSASVLPMNIQGWEGSPYHTDRKLGRCGFLKNEEKFPLPRRRKTGKPKVRG